MFTYLKTSSGEYLCSELFERLVDTAVWDRLENRHLHTTGRSSSFRLFFQEALALNMTRRLILFAEHLTKNANADDPHFLVLLKTAISRLGLMELDRQGKISRLTQSALINSRHSISPTLRRQMFDWGRRKHQGCYMCGRTLSFDSVDEGGDGYATLDHLWPQAYGGDSVIENLLPACGKCNSQKKQDYASWAGCNIHTLMIGMNPSGGALKSVGQHFQYALYNRGITEYANRNKCLLKDSYISHGAWRPVVGVINEDDVGDFFNLFNHCDEEYI